MEIIHEHIDFKKLFSISEKFILSSTGTINNLNYNRRPVINFTGNATATLTGILSAEYAGQLLIIENSSNHSLILQNENSSSNALNRFSFAFSKPLILLNKEKAILFYNNSRWELLSFYKEERITNFVPSTLIKEGSSYYDETLGIPFLLISKTERTTDTAIFGDINNNYITQIYKSINVIPLNDSSSFNVFTGMGVGSNQKGLCNIIFGRETGGGYKYDFRYKIKIGFDYQFGGGVLYPYPSSLNIAETDIANNLCIYNSNGNYIIKNNLGYNIILILMYEAMITE